MSDTSERAEQQQMRRLLAATAEKLREARRLVDSGVHWERDTEWMELIREDDITEVRRLLDELTEELS